MADGKAEPPTIGVSFDGGEQAVPGGRRERTEALAHGESPFLKKTLRIPQQTFKCKNRCQIQIARSMGEKGRDPPRAPHEFPFWHNESTGSAIPSTLQEG